jgi:hypothetical protein
MNFTHYHFPLNRDKIFRSLDLAFSNKWAVNGYTQITDLDLLPKVIKWAKLANHASPNFLTIIKNIDDDPSNNKINPLQSISMLLITIPPLIIQFPISPTLPTYYNNKEPSSPPSQYSPKQIQHHKYPYLYKYGQISSSHLAPHTPNPLKTYRLHTTS